MPHNYAPDAYPGGPLPGSPGSVPEPEPPVDPPVEPPVVPEPEPPGPITVDFSITSTSMVNPPPHMPIMDVWFWDQSTADAGIASWHWLLPGGMPAIESNEQNPTTAYITPDVYLVTVTVTDNDGNSDSLTLGLEIPLLDDYDQEYHDRATLIRPAPNVDSTRRQ